MAAARAVAAILAVAAVLAAVCAWGRARFAAKRGRFVSAEAARVHAQARGVFAEKDGAPSYSDYKRAVGGADPVQFREVRRLHGEGGLTARAVEAALR